MNPSVSYNDRRVATDQRPREYQFDLSGGHLALDFANSVSRRDSPERRVDHITSYEALVSFGLQSKLINSQQAEALQAEAQRNHRCATQALRKAVVLREAMFRSFMRVSEGAPASAEDIGMIEKSALEALRHRRIVRVNGTYAWNWDLESSLESLLWPIAQAAADLLISKDLAKVRECEADDCEWLFLDTSRNHSRRWCDMTSCGNREKARRHYRRHTKTH
jgi:predicted RNA-binding Zn ribbon-like protein